MRLLNKILLVLFLIFSNANSEYAIIKEELVTKSELLDFAEKRAKRLKKLLEDRISYCRKVQNKNVLKLTEKELDTISTDIPIVGLIMAKNMALCDINESKNYAFSLLSIINFKKKEGMSYEDEFAELMLLSYSPSLEREVLYDKVVKEKKEKLENIIGDKPFNAIKLVSQIKQYIENRKKDSNLTK